MQNKNNPEGHEGPARRFVQFGGGISAEQLDWFVQQLADARAADQRVIVCGHLPMHPGTCIGTCLLWNYEEVLQAIWDAGNVVATISGHAHNVSLCTPNALFALSQTSHYDAMCTSCPCKDTRIMSSWMWLTSLHQVVPLDLLSPVNLSEQCFPVHLMQYSVKLYM